MEKQHRNTGIPSLVVHGSGIVLEWNVSISRKFMHWMAMDTIDGNMPSCEEMGEDDINGKKGAKTRGNDHTAANNPGSEMDAVFKTEDVPKAENKNCNTKDDNDISSMGSKDQEAIGQDTRRRDRRGDTTDRTASLVREINRKKREGESFYIDLMNLEAVVVGNESMDSFVRAQILSGLANDLVFYRDGKSAERIARMAIDEVEKILTNELLHPADICLLEKLLIRSHFIVIRLGKKAMAIKESITQLASKQERIYKRATRNTAKEILSFCLEAAQSKSGEESMSSELLLLALSFVRDTEDVELFVENLLTNHSCANNLLSQRITEMISERERWRKEVIEYLTVLLYVVSDFRAPPYSLLNASKPALYFLFLTLLKEDSFQKALAALQAIKMIGRKDLECLARAVKYIIVTDMRHRIVLGAVRDDKDSDHKLMNEELHFVTKFLEDIVLFFSATKKYQKIIVPFEKHSLAVEYKSRFAEILLVAYLETDRTELAAQLYSKSPGISAKVMFKYFVALNKEKKVLSILRTEKKAENILFMFETALKRKKYDLLIAILRSCVQKYECANATLGIAILYYATECIASQTSSQTQNTCSSECIHRKLFQLILRIRADSEPPLYVYLLVRILVKLLNHLYCLSRQESEEYEVARKTVVRNMPGYVRECLATARVEEVAEYCRAVYSHCLGCSELTMEVLWKCYEEISSCKKTGESSAGYWRVITMIYHVAGEEYMYELVIEMERILMFAMKEKKKGELIGYSLYKETIVECLCLNFRNELFDRATEVGILDEKGVLRILEAGVRKGSVKKIIEKIKKSDWMKRKKISRFVSGI